ncbi:MAG: 2-dehydropantoate 2-reductase N-terminal domain-containing protein [Chloroflexota bacterium]
MDKAKLLVYGAGPLGSLFAARLQAAGHEVTLLARGQRLEQLRQHGLVLINAENEEQTVTQVQLVERLDPQDAYDLVLVIMRKNKALEILPTLAANPHTPNVLFLMNNAAGPGELVAALGKERVLCGFPSSGGMREGYAMRYLGGSAERVIPIPFGEVDGAITGRTQWVAEILGSMPGYSAEIMTDMDAWLKTHAALLMPSLVPALYACDTDNLRMARTRDALVLAVRAIREGFGVLHALGIPLLPASMRRLERLPEPVLVKMLQALLVRPQSKVAIVGHALAAPDELQHLADEFIALARSNAIPTPAIDRLYPYFDPGTPRLPDGSAEIPLDWRGIGPILMLAGGVLSGLCLAGYLVFKRRQKNKATRM